MKSQSNTVNAPTPTPVAVQPTANQVQINAAFWYQELAPVSFFAPPAAQNIQVNQDEMSVIPMSTNLGSFTA